MDPFTLLLAGLSAGGSLIKGFAGSAAAELQGKVAAGNAKLLTTQADIQAGGADIARSKGTFEQYRLADRVARVQASATSHFAAAGLDPTASSPLVLAGHSAAQGESDAQIIRASEALDAANALTASANTRGQATNQLYTELGKKQEGFADIVSGVFGAATSFLKPFGAGGGDSGAGGPAAGGGNPFEVAA